MLLLTMSLPNSGVIRLAGSLEVVYGRHNYTDRSTLERHDLPIFYPQTGDKIDAFDISAINDFI